MEYTDSVLTSVKKLLGLDESMKDFDVDVAINVNAAIETLRQLGANIPDGYMIRSEVETYEDMLGEEIKLRNQVEMYFYLKTRLGFDPPSNSYLVDSIKEQIDELEFRILVRLGSDSKENKKGGENSK